MKNEEIKKMLSFDAIDAAEKLTGKSYKEDLLTEVIGVATQMENNKEKEKVLKALHDSTYGTSEKEYLEIVKSIGFEPALIEPFLNKGGIEERLHIMWHNDYSILLVFDTYTWLKDGGTPCEPNVNRGEFYYEHIQNNDSNISVTSSGGYIGNGDDNHTYTTLFNRDLTPHLLPEHFRLSEPVRYSGKYEEYREIFDVWCERVESYIQSNDLIKVWSGSHDCREAIKFNISQLNENGAFVKQWKKTPFLWLLSYMDTKQEGYNHEEITENRLSKLPSHILKAINFKKRKNEL